MPTYREHVLAAIAGIASRKGASAIAIEKFIKSNNPDLDFKRHFLRAAIKSALEKGLIAVHHQHKGSYKLIKQAAPKKKKAAPKKKKAAPKKKKTATKKKKTTKKKTATKKKTTKKKK